MARCRQVLALMATIAIVLSLNVAAGDAVTDRFSAHDPASSIRVDYQPWSTFLSKTVVFAGYSKSRLARGRKRTWAHSRMRYGNDLPSRYENNRVVLGQLGAEHLAFIEQYRAGLASLAERAPLSALNRAEQLAYWLNLYNIHALEHVAKHYPEETTEKLRSRPGGPADGIWHEKTLEVTGVALSLRDIETKILFPIWQDPRVLYGLWQGAIGGPRLPRRAYTGAEVWKMLEENAREFVNSNRGMAPSGRVLELSLLYGWGKPLFPDEPSLRRHIEQYAVPPFSRGIEETSTIEVERYDWHLADLSGGTHHRGAWNAPGGALLSALENSPGNQFLVNSTILQDDTRRRLSALTLDLLQGMARHNERERTPVVTIEECESGPECEQGGRTEDD